MASSQYPGPSRCPTCNQEVESADFEAAGECPVCGKRTYHVTNHVRMSPGDGHGPMGGYPDGWEEHSYQGRENAEVSLSE